MVKDVHGCCKVDLIWVVAGWLGYILRCFTCPRTGTHVGDNHCQRRATSYIEINAVASTATQAVLHVLNTEAGRADIGSS